MNIANPEGYNEKQVWYPRRLPLCTLPTPCKSSWRKFWNGAKTGTGFQIFPAKMTAASSDSDKEKTLIEVDIYFSGVGTIFILGGPT